MADARRQEEPRFVADDIDSAVSSYLQLEHFLSYWRGIRGDKSMPCRADFDPRDHPRLLPYLSMLEVVDGGRDFFYRVAGSATESVIGTSLQNTHLSFYPFSAPFLTLRKACRTVLQDKTPLLIEGYMQLPFRRRQMFATLLLPLSEDDESVNRILILSYFAGVN